MTVLDGQQARSADFLIIGAQRSASSYLHHCLREHPQLFLPRNEVVYFEDPYYEQRDAAFLPRLFAAAKRTQRCGFKRPELLSRTECPGRISQELPDARLIAVLREPISRSVSAYFHYVRAGVVPLAPLNVGMRRILRGELDADFPKAREVVEYSRYGEHLLRYYQRFQPSSILVLLDEDFRQDAVATLQQVHSFLDVQPDFLPSTLNQRANAGVYSLPRLRLLRAGSRFIYRYQSGSPYVALRDNLGTRIAYRAVRWVDRTALAPLYGNAIPELDEDVRLQLTELFAPDLDQLETMLNRPLDRWRQAGA